VLVNYDIHDATKLLFVVWMVHLFVKLSGMVINSRHSLSLRNTPAPATYQRMRQRGEEKVRLAEAENVHTLPAPAEGLAAGNVYRPSGTHRHAGGSGGEEYTEDEYLNNSLDMLESNKRKNAI
jgi:putative transposase